jgi:hypothetical protein
MQFFERWRTLPRNKSKKELDEHYQQMDVEKGDMPAMFLAGFLAFGPILLVLAVAFVLILIFL